MSTKEGLSSKTRWWSSPPVARVFAALALVGFVGLLREALVGQQHLLYRPLRGAAHSTYASSSMAPVNSTLDFARIFVVHQKHRWNRRDEMSLMAAATGLKLTYADAPRPFELSYNGLPWHPQEEVRATELAQFRAHADVWRHMVEHDIGSAWIVEDDSDWDEAIKDQFIAFKAPFATLLSSMQMQHGFSPRTRQQRTDPYASKAWDILFTGSCSEEREVNGDDDNELPPSPPPLISYQDNTVAGCEQLHAGHQQWMQSVATATKDDSLTCVPWLSPTQHKLPVRIVTHARSPRCLSSYAISNSGATKALFYLSRGLTARLDEALAHLAELDLINAFTVVPAFTSTWKIEDPTGHNNPSRGHSIGLRSGIRRHLKRALFE